MSHWRPGDVFTRVPRPTARASFLWMSFVILVGSGCAGWNQGHRDNAMAEFDRTTLAKAAFSLDCEKDQVQVLLVPEEEPFPNNALVSGCGNKATYVKTSQGWIMESGPGK
jgi:hypothetical protein